MDLVIEGKAFIDNKFEQCCIGINQGKIVEVKKILKGDEHINVKNKIILPAGIDAHVHFRDPGMTHKEDFFTGSVSAAYGGISCVFDMPNTKPQTVTNSNLIDKIDIAKKKSVIDFGINAGITNSNIKSIRQLAKNASGFKIYLGSSTNSLLLDVTKLKEAFEEIKKTENPVLFHAENEKLLSKYKIEEHSLKDHLKSRPSICESSSISEIFRYAAKSNIRGHICHISSIEGIDVIQNRPENFTVGITPHHALLNFEKAGKPETKFKVNPPIRSNFDREALLSSFAKGIIDIFESDHAPHTWEEKESDFEQAPSGLPGVETIYPLGLYLANKGVLSIERLIDSMCKNPAKLMNVKKGVIKQGYDADLIIVDFKEKSTISSDELHYKCQWSPFEDFPAVFPETIFLRGEKLIDEGELQVKAGFGKVVGE